MDTTNTYKVLGWTDEVTNCDCCGKSKLSGTFAIMTPDGEIVHYGSVCTTRNTGLRDPKGLARLQRERMREAADVEWKLSAEYKAYAAVWFAGAPCSDFAPISQASTAKRKELWAQYLTVPAAAAQGAR